MKRTAVVFALFLLASLTACGRQAPDITDTSVTPLAGKLANQTVVQTEPTERKTMAKVESSTVPFQPEVLTGKADDKANTFTGYRPLPAVTFSVSDPHNERKLPETAINHSFGVAKNEKPHQISVDSQAFFDQKGYNAVTYDNKTSDKVLYLTFDCGYENGLTGRILDILKERNVPAAFFCTLDHIRSAPELIARMIAEGHIIGNHSARHPNFTKITRTQMAEEIEACDNFLRERFGYSAPYFRFPEGAYSENALELVQSLGYQSVFWSLAYSDWDTTHQKGREYAFQTITQRLHPGAIILLHAVSADNAQALGDVIDYARRQGYEFRALTQLA